MAHFVDYLAMQFSGVGVGAEVGLEGFGADVEGVEVGDEGAGDRGGGIVVDGDGAAEASEGKGGGLSGSLSEFDVAQLGDLASLAERDVS